MRWLVNIIPSFCRAQLLHRLRIQSGPARALIADNGGNSISQAVVGHPLLGFYLKVLRWCGEEGVAAETLSGLGHFAGVSPWIGPVLRDCLADGFPVTSSYYSLPGLCIKAGPRCCRYLRWPLFVLSCPHHLCYQSLLYSIIAFHSLVFMFKCASFLIKVCFLLQVFLLPDLLFPGPKHRGRWDSGVSLHAPWTLRC